MVVKSVNVKLMIILWASFLPLISSHRRPFWTKAPVCEAYNLPVNAEWIPRTSCDDNKKFQCLPGHETSVQTICKDGHWSLELICLVKKKQNAKTCAANQTLSPSSNDSIPPGVYQDTHDFKCLPQYIKKGNNGTVRCNAMGQWEIVKECEDCFIRGISINITYFYQNVTYPETCESVCETKSYCKTFKKTAYNCYLFLDNSFLTFGTGISQSLCIETCMYETRCLFMQHSLDTNVCFFFAEKYEDLSRRIGTLNKESDRILVKDTCPSLL